MNLISALTLLLLFVAENPTRPEPSIPYFTNVRDVHIAEPANQNYFIVDEEIWSHSRSDLGDLRLYAGDSPVQYAISEQRDGVASEEVEVKILNLGVVSGHTEFDIDTQGLQEYDRVRLRLSAHNFVVTAFVSGGNALGETAKVELTPSTLYDFAKEHLGSNSVLKFVSSSFRYLHVNLSPGILPQDVKGATIYHQHEQHANWTKIGSCAAPQQKQRSTVLTCSLPDRTPLSRISFQVAPSQVNFRRSVTVEDAKGMQIAVGEISRVRLNRAGTVVTDEQLTIHVQETSGQFTVSIDNGDNPALDINAVQPLASERRIYFDPQGKTNLKLYYGDEKLLAPIYDYARFFHLEASPAQAELESGAHNPLYAGRPDDRPWSERHMGVLWAAMLAVVLALAFMAMRGLRSRGPE